MPTVQFASDLHLEFTSNSDYLRTNPLVPVADILVLAGDIGYIGKDSYESHPFWDWASDNFQLIIVIPGNHEFYGSYDLGNLRNGMRICIRKNIHLYYNAVITIEDTEFILSPLFSMIPHYAKAIITNRLADIKYVLLNGEAISVEGYNKMNSDCRAFLRTALSALKPRSRRIVVTHYAPSLKCIHPNFAGSILNSAFYNDMDAEIENSGADYWIYGHSHRNTEAIQVGGTTLLTNQLGYVHLQENLSFNKSSYI